MLDIVLRYILKPDMRNPIMFTIPGSSAMAWQPGTTFVIKQIALFFNMPSRFSKKGKL
jgi:hypothetical protein